MSRQVVFATISLHQMAGGLERNIVRIANYLAERGYDVSLLSFDFPEAEAFYQINPKITWHRLGRTEPHKAISFSERLKLFSRIRSVLPKWATIIVFHHGLLVRLMLSGIGLGNKIICSERSALSMYDHIRASKWNLNFFLMGFVSKILVQFESYRQNYPFWMRPKIQAIPNVVEMPSAKALTGIPNVDGRFQILAVGRLCDQKNYAALIQAFSNISAKFQNWDLVIIGSGGFGKSLMEQIKHLGLSERIMLPGASQNVETWYLKSHIYAMPSKWEGFPNALAEALAHGLPSVGYAGCAGVADLIEHGKNGVLSEGNGNVKSLSEEMEKLMADIQLRNKMSAAAIQSVSGYSAEKIYPQWENLFKDF